MGRLRIVAFTIVCFWLPGTPCLAQPSETDPLQEYQRFLDEHKDMTTSELLAMYPAGDFQEQLNLPWESVQYHDLIDAACQLTADEQRLLERNGFVASERLRQPSVVDQLLYIYRNDLPLFISTDAILHALGRSYDRIIQDVELGLLVDRLSTLLTRMHGGLAELDAKYSSTPRMGRMLRDVDVYLTVARKLLGHQIAPHYPQNLPEIDGLLALVKQGGLATWPLFAENCRQIDFSQFTPRGHYTQHEDLMKYFRAMMWLGRTEMYLSAPQNVAEVPCPAPTPEDIQRQTIDAVLVLELMDTPEAEALYDEVENTLRFLAGEQDNLTAGDLKGLVESLALDDASQLLDPAELVRFQDRLRAEGLGSQGILSQVLIQDPMAPETVQPASAFLLFGQRFAIDSYITGNVVKIKYQDEIVCRLFPSTLDILFALGNDVAGPLLASELDQYHYSSNLAPLRFLVDSHDSSFWQASIYNTWLDVLRVLSPPAERGSLPVFMQTTAWWHEKMNTQLASWAELRHNNILYAKQSYTPGFICSYPGAYVEPFPEFYRRLRVLADASRHQFRNVVVPEPPWDPWSDPIPPLGIMEYFERFSSIMGTLETIARKELEGTPLMPEEVEFMKEMLYLDMEDLVCYHWYYPDGWYADLLYGEDAVEPDEWEEAIPEYVVADYHTVPTDCAGGVRGWVLHAGTGPVDLAVIVAETPEGGRSAFVGPVMSYYEYTTTDFQRLTDEEWQSTYLSQAKRPAWVSSYLANEAGEPYEPQ